MTRAGEKLLSILNHPPHGLIEVGAGIEFFVQGQQAGELLNGGFVIVHANIDEAIVETGVTALGAHHEQRGGLFAALVPTGGLGRGDGGN